MLRSGTFGLVQSRAVAVMLGLCLSASLLAQSRESIEVRITELDVTVLDRNGRPVEGLGKDDFEVRLSGKPAPVVNFFEVKRGIIADDQAPAQTAIPTSLIIFIDELHLRQGSRKRAFDALQRYVRHNIGPLTTATLIRYNKHLDVRTRPTDKPGYILAELEKLEQETFLGSEGDREREAMIQQIDEALYPLGRMAVAGGATNDTTAVFYRLENYVERLAAEVDRSLKALENAIDLISGFEGRKVLLYVSEGLPQQPGAELIEYWEHAERNSANQDLRVRTLRLDTSKMMRFDRSASFRRAAEAARRARVAIYSFDAAGVRGFEGRTIELAGTVGRMNSMLAQSNLRGGVQQLTEQTGGRYISNENDVDKILDMISTQFTTYYSLGVQAPPRSRSSEAAVTVRNRPELQVIASRPRVPLTREEEIEQNIRARLYTRAAANPLHVTLSAGKPANVAGDCVATVQITATPPKLGAELTPEAMELHFVMLNDRNDESEMRRAHIGFAYGRVTHAMTLRIQPRPHVLSLALANPLSGEVSYLQADIDGAACR